MMNSIFQSANSRIRSSKNALIAAALCGAIGAAVPASAHATDYIYWPTGGGETSWGLIPGGGERYGERHSIRANSARTTDPSNQVCNRTLDEAGNPTATACGTGLVVQDQYCGCVLRFPTVINPYTSGSLGARARGTY